VYGLNINTRYNSW